MLLLLHKSNVLLKEIFGEHKRALENGKHDSQNERFSMRLGR